MGIHPPPLLIIDFSRVSGRFKHSGKRDKVFLASKFGYTATGANGKPEYVRAAAEKSLKNLGVETIDLYYVHVSLLCYDGQ